MIVNKLDNDGWSIQKEPDEVLSLEEQNLAVAILWHIEDMDLLGEQGCVGNFDMYQCFYNYHTDKKYMILLGRDGEAFLRGEPVVLEAMEMTEEDRTMIA
ncbi:hypothetical protein [Clostridium porci]|uniref:Uncharacterized protein n=1 Tax=Clostridium porci TaxID=2605778 RepID=A0A7X2TE77_9CLOT|nr:hypothetical protein [Clostridium porci]MSS38320.1 hypothetical protein [Clostridium porci]